MWRLRLHSDVLQYLADLRTLDNEGDEPHLSAIELTHMLYSVTALFVFQLLGQALVQVIGLPLPGPLVGMLMLFASLWIYGRVPEPLAETTGKLLQHMMLLFIPAVAGVMMHFGRVADEWKPFLIACAVGAAVTMVVTALTLRALLRIKTEAGR